MYRLVKIMRYDESDEQIALAGLRHPRHGYAMWHRCTVRKDWECRVTGEAIHSGDVAYRPVTDGYNRMHRISLDGMLVLAHRAHERLKDED